MFYNFKLLSEFMDRNGMTEKEFCKYCRISMVMLKRIYENKRVKSETLYKIWEATLICMEEFVVNV